MKFFDEINIYISSGTGGNGISSFYKNKNSKYKISDGGDGGKGGDIYLIGNKNYYNFNKLNSKKKYKAEDGQNGKNNYKSGKNGKNLNIYVPLGTIIYDKEKKFFLGEITKHEEKLLIAKGGRKGYGNATLKQYKNVSTQLKIGGGSEIKFLHLELFLTADIGLLGLPNVGKSSLINKISNSTSKIGEYSFTTLKPHLGVLKNFIKKQITIADIPGIIKNASKGKGLGFNFLKHLLKNKLLFHIIDINQKKKLITILKEILTIKTELKNFDKIFVTKKKWLIINKIDLLNNFNYNKNKKLIFEKINYDTIFFVSIKKSIGLKKLCFNVKEYFLKT